jgi:hypothetical protein
MITKLCQVSGEEWTAAGVILARFRAGHVTSHVTNNNSTPHVESEFAW